MSRSTFPVTDTEADTNDSVRPCREACGQACCAPPPSAAFEKVLTAQPSPNLQRRRYTRWKWCGREASAAHLASPRLNAETPDHVEQGGSGHAQEFRSWCKSSFCLIKNP